jgi:hypothetical protein
MRTATGWAKLPMRQGGHGWLEIGVAAVVIAVLGATLLTRLLDYLALVERTTIEATIINMRAGLRLRIAGLLTSGHTRDIAGLAGMNPVNLLERPPEGYRGEIGPERAESDLSRGDWFFNIRERELIYLVNNNAGSMPLGGVEGVVRLQVVAKGSVSRDSLPAVSIQVANPNSQRRDPNPAKNPLTGVQQ